MKNLDKKQAVLCHRKPLGRQRTRQRYLPQCIIGFLLLLISIAIQAQIPQELIDKARAAGMTEEQIQREIAKHRTEQMDHGSDFPYRHDCASLIIYHHCRYEDGVRS